MQGRYVELVEQFLIQLDDIAAVAHVALDHDGKVHLPSDPARRSKSTSATKKRVIQMTKKQDRRLLTCVPSTGGPVVPCRIAASVQKVRTCPSCGR